MSASLSPSQAPPTVPSPGDERTSLLATITRPGIGAVIALTILGGVLRLIRLDQPPLIYDEAATYTRVTGTFHELLEILRFDGFAPLHYELYWLMSRLVTMSPFMMRLVPALAGTAMVPSIYFLARQLASKRVATLAAALTCCSAYLLIYSRDAKMYMHLWLFATLFIASLLWWMRKPMRLAWLCWVAAGCAMNGLHALGLCVVGVALFITFTHPLLTRRRLLLAMLGLVIVCAGLAGHYAFFNRFREKVQQVGWRNSGLEWIELRNRPFTKAFLTWEAPAGWLLAYRAPRPPVTPPQRVATPMIVVSIALGALLIVGALPWSGRLRDDAPEQAPAETTRGRTALWLIAWIAIPMYAFYCTSFSDARSPFGLMWIALRPLIGWGIVFVPLLAWLASAAMRERRVLFLATTLLPIALLAPLAFSLVRQSYDRPISEMELWLGLGLAPPFASAALVVLPGMGIAHFAKSSREAPIRDVLPWIGLIAVLLAIWLFTRGRVTHDVWTARYLGVVWPSVAVLVSLLILRIPVGALRGAAIVLLIGANLLQYTLRMTVPTGVPVDRVARDVGAAQRSRGETRTIIAVNEDLDAPSLGGAGGIFDFPGRYYLALATGKTFHPMELRTKSSATLFELQTNYKRVPGRVKHLIVWEDGQKLSGGDSDPVLKQLGSNWKRTRSDEFGARDFWCWRRIFRCRRSEYVRKELVRESD